MERVIDKNGFFTYRDEVPPDCKNNNEYLTFECLTLQDKIEVLQEDNLLLHKRLSEVLNATPGLKPLGTSGVSLENRIFIDWLDNTDSILQLLDSQFRVKKEKEI